MNYARIINKIAVDVSTAPLEQFHPDIAAEFVEVPADVVPGSSVDAAGVWTIAPAPVALPVVVVPPKVSPVQFKLLLTSPERIAIKGTRSTDPVIDDFFDLLDDPRLTEVDLALTSTQDAVAHSINVVAPGLSYTAAQTTQRIADILAGQVQ